MCVEKVVYVIYVFYDYFFFKQKAAYEVRISDWSSDVCSSDLEYVEVAGSGKECESRRKRPMEVPAELDSRFLRVGNKLYRSAHDKQPVATITPDRIKTRDPNSLPDLIRLAKENGWTAIKVSGDAEFQRAAYLAASAQGIKVDGYKPDEK